MSFKPNKRLLPHTTPLPHQRGRCGVWAFDASHCGGQP